MSDQPLSDFSNIALERRAEILCRWLSRTSVKREKNRLRCHLAVVRAEQVARRWRK